QKQAYYCFFVLMVLCGFFWKECSFTGKNVELMRGLGWVSTGRGTGRIRRRAQAAPRRGQ
ncbi:MAG: hypothetical protein ACKOJF_05145, partial [Planctomycetaceae bacterium]